MYTIVSLLVSVLTLSLPTSATMCACFSMGEVSLAVNPPGYGGPSYGGPTYGGPGYGNMLGVVENDTTFLFDNSASKTVNVIGPKPESHEIDFMNGSFVCKCKNSYVERTLKYILVASGQHGNVTTVESCIGQHVMRMICSQLRDMKLVHDCLTSWSTGFTGVVHECVMRSGLLADMVKHVARPIVGSCVDAIAFVGAEDVISIMA